MIKKEAEKILKYKSLIIGMHCMWKVGAKVTPIIIGATETISKLLGQYLSNIQRRHETEELQDTAVFGTGHILREVLMQQYITNFTGEITVHVAQIVHTEQLQQYVPGKHGLF
jgi:hypothetical protein